MRKRVVLIAIFSLAFLFVHLPAQHNSSQQQQQQHRTRGVLKPSHFRPEVQLGNEIFLQGLFIEVGIHSAGSFGTSQYAPAGFHTWPNYASGPYEGRLGFVADQGRDGWGVGTPPQTGDYFVPGSPEEGWSVEWTVGGSERPYSNFGLMGSFNVPRTSSGETTSGTTP